MGLSRTSAMLREVGEQGACRKGVKNPQPAEVAGSWESIGNTEVMANGPTCAWFRKTSNPKTYHPTAGIQIPGVSERLAGAPVQGSCLMAAEFLSAARVPGAGCSPQGRKPSRLQQEVQAAEMPQQ